MDFNFTYYVTQFCKRFFSSRFSGFTLVQALIDLTILGILVVTLVLLIDPVAQFSKAKDATRKNDIEQIKKALDTYYNDTSCYPTVLPFNNRWQENGMTYMSQVPQDPDCANNPSSCYIYQVDTSSSCPQWNILYTKQQKPQQGACALEAFTSTCIPPNFDPSWACSLSGSIDCPFVSSSPVVPSLFSEDTSQSETTLSPTPSSGGESCEPSERSYVCSGTPQRCNVVAPGSGTYCSSDCSGACQ